jgi:hypothetical protein
MTDIGGKPEQVVSTDRFYAPGAGPESGLFDLHDWLALCDLLRRVRAIPVPQRLVYPVRTYEGIERTVDGAMPPAVVVEGIRLIRPKTMPLFDVAVWIDLSPETAGSRAMERNHRQGDSLVEIDLWRTKWIPEGHAYAKVIGPERLAHVVLDAAGANRAVGRALGTPSTRLGTARAAASVDWPQTTGEGGAPPGSHTSGRIARLGAPQRDRPDPARSPPWLSKCPPPATRRTSGRCAAP